MKPSAPSNNAMPRRGAGIRVLTVSIVAIAFLTVAATMASATPTGSAAGNSGNAKACQQDGWRNWRRSDETTFANAGDCISYGANSGTLTEPAAPPVITSFAISGACFLPQSVGYTWTSTGGTTAVLEERLAAVNGGDLLDSLVVPTNGSISGTSFSALPHCGLQVTLIVTGPGGTDSQTI